MLFNNRLTVTQENVLEVGMGHFALPRQDAHLVAVEESRLRVNHYIAPRIQKKVWISDCHAGFLLGGSTRSRLHPPPPRPHRFMRVFPWRVRPLGLCRVQWLPLCELHHSGRHAQPGIGDRGGEDAEDDLTRKSKALTVQPV